MTECDNSGQTRDDLQNGFFIIQDKKGFRFGIDAVLLADFAQAGPGEKVMDLGSGSGIIPLLLAARGRGSHITGIEIDGRTALLAQRNIAENGLEDRISVIRGDLREAATMFGRASFDVVVSNPPYRKTGTGKLPADPALVAARHEVCCTFDDVAAASEALLTQEGRLYIVHRAERETEIIETLRAHALHPARVRRVRPFADRKPNLILIEASRTEAPAVTEEPLTVYSAPGVYTDEIYRIYGIKAPK